jgi:hypothetical protein
MPPYTVDLTGAGLERPVIEADPSSLEFDDTVIGESTSKTLTVTLTHPQSPLTEESFSLSGGEESVYSLSFDEDVVTVTFTPLAEVEYKDTLIINADYAEEVRIPLVGEGFKPLISAVPEALEFDEVEIGNSATETLTVTLTDAVPDEDDLSFSLAGGNESVFDFSFAEDVVTVTFAPLTAVEYNDTLIIQAAYADTVRIPLVGTGKLGTGLSVPQESGTYLSVREGNVVVIEAPVNSRISLYNLQGIAVLIQEVTSKEEILKTSGLPRGVYILAVRNDKGEILKRKVVL